MERFTSRSFWIACLIILASIYFTYAKIMDGSQWVTLATVVLGLWQVKDAVVKFKGSE